MRRWLLWQFFVIELGRAGTIPFVPYKTVTNEVFRAPLAMSDADGRGRNDPPDESLERGGKQQKNCAGQTASGRSMEDTDGPSNAVPGTAVPHVSVLTEVLNGIVTNIAAHPSVLLETTTLPDGTVRANARTNLEVYDRQQAQQRGEADPHRDASSNPPPGTAPRSQSEEVRDPGPMAWPMGSAAPTAAHSDFDVGMAAKQAFAHASAAEGLVSVSVSVGYRSSTTGIDGAVVTQSRTESATVAKAEPASELDGSAMDTTGSVCLPCSPTSLPAPIQSAAMPPMPDLPPLPPKKDRPEGKYISNGSSQNGFTPKVVYFKAGAKRVEQSCWAQGCKNRAVFGPKGTVGSQHAVFCAEHRNDQLHEDVVHKRCAAQGCKTQAIFGPIGTFGKKHAVYCAEHRDKQLHEDVASKRCAAQGCKTVPTFGPVDTFGWKHAVYCAGHRNDQLHEDVVSKRCEAPGCTTRAIYGPKGSKHAIFCAEHRDDQLHEDVVSKRCEAPGCTTRASYGPKGSKRAIFCVDHCDKQLHEDVVNKRCEAPGCTTRASHGPKGSKHAIFCAEHCDRQLHEDVVKKRCTTDGCPKFAHIHDPDDASVHVCIVCAGNLGLVAKSKAGASVACSLCFDELVEELGVKIDWRVTYHSDGTRTGAEKFGLVPDQPRLHSDGYTEPEGDQPGTVIEFHGDYYHGYPPWHPKHETSVFRGRWGPTRYKETMERMELFKAQGLRVLYIWESDWLATKNTGATLTLRDALREL